MFRSVRHLKVYKCMCSSPTTCCQNGVIGILPATRLLPVISYIISYIEVWIDLTIYFSTYFGVVISLQHYPCITYSAFLRYHTFKLHGVVYTVQKCMLRYSTYISLREGPNLCLSVWFTSFWVVLGIQHLHSIHFEVFLAITEDFHHTL